MSSSVLHIFSALFHMQIFKLHFSLQVLEHVLLLVEIMLQSQPLISFSLILRGSEAFHHPNLKSCYSEKVHHEHEDLLRGTIDLAYEEIVGFGIVAEKLIQSLTRGTNELDVILIVGMGEQLVRDCCIKLKSLFLILMFKHGTSWFQDQGR
ncbi:hypothetical protein H5410_045250 [Solanum commersonii]|uniref:Uncharacterized protein n=1 Tax=Solanum commersonii TaxID=4109 RepID=A0A9J5XD54_SOLCO|nr:hypothetical protein H5410_045250 [Solanum commersonii]